MTITAGLLPIAAAWPLKQLVDLLAAGAFDQGRIAYLTGAIALAGIISGLLPRLVEYTKAELGRQARWIAAHDLWRAADAQVGLAPFENPDQQERMQHARGLGVDAPARAFDGALSFAQSAVILASFYVALLSFGVVMPTLVLLAAALPAVMSESAMTGHRLGATLTISRAQRREFFFANLLLDPRAARETRLFGTGPFLRALMGIEIAGANRAARTMDRRVLRRETTVQALGTLVSAAVIVWGVHRVITDTMTLGDLTLAIASVSATQASAGALVASAVLAHQNILIFRSLTDVVDQPSELPVATEPVTLDRLTTNITFHDVWFRYQDELPWVLKGVSFTIQAGRTTAIVGLNGAGKSTVASLICRFYDPTRGRITWNGVDLKDADPGSLRSQVRAVFQDPTRYDLSVETNIGMGDIDPYRNGRADVVSAAHLVQAEKFIMDLPDGYATLLGNLFGPREESDLEAVAQLSGGQWQRLGIARGLVHPSPSLLMLDELSASLDPIAEAAIHSAVRRRAQNCALVIITHRLGMINDDDYILVLDNGQITQRGRHRELVTSDGGYSEMFHLQADGYRDRIGGGTQA